MQPNFNIIILMSPPFQKDCPLMMSTPTFVSTRCPSNPLPRVTYSPSAHNSRDDQYTMYISRRLRSGDGARRTTQSYVRLVRREPRQVPCMPRLANVFVFRRIRTLMTIVRNSVAFYHSRISEPCETSPHYVFPDGDVLKLVVIMVL